MLKMIGKFKLEGLNVLTGEGEDKTDLLKRIHLEISTSYGRVVTFANFTIAYVTDTSSFTTTYEVKTATDINRIFFGCEADRGHLLLNIPEARLTFSQQRNMAKLLYQVASDGVQVFLTTNSLFLMREFCILQEEDPGAKIHYINYFYSNFDNRINTEQGSIDDIKNLVPLDEELNQSSRYIDVFSKKIV